MITSLHLNINQLRGQTFIDLRTNCDSNHPTKHEFSEGFAVTSPGK